MADWKILNLDEAERAALADELRKYAAYREGDLDLDTSERGAELRDDPTYAYDEEARAEALEWEQEQIDQFQQQQVAAASPYRELADHVEQTGRLDLTDDAVRRDVTEVIENTGWRVDGDVQDAPPQPMWRVVDAVAFPPHPDRDASLRLGADPLLPLDDVPTIAELAEQLRDEYRDLADWSVHENDAFAQVFEFKDHRRMQVWDEANFMGSIDGYSWQEQLWSGSEWVDVTEISTENGVPPLSVQELRAHLDAFRIEAEATRPETLTQREAALDRMARVALVAAAGNARKVNQLEVKLNKTVEDLRASERENEKIRTALIGLAQRITPPARRQPSSENTGPVTGSPTASPSGPGL